MVVLHVRLYADHHRLEKTRAAKSTTITLASRTPAVSWRLGIHCAEPLGPELGRPLMGLSCSVIQVVPPLRQQAFLFIFVW